MGMRFLCKCFLPQLMEKQRHWSQSHFTEALVETSATQSSGVRILNSKIELPSTRGSATQNDIEIWYLNLSVETDSAEVLSLDQSPVGARFADEPFLLDGGSFRATLSADSEAGTPSSSSRRKAQPCYSSGTCKNPQGRY